MSALSLAPSLDEGLRHTFSYTDSTEHGDTRRVENPIITHTFWKIYIYMYVCMFYTYKYIHYIIYIIYHIYYIIYCILHIYTYVYVISHEMFFAANGHVSGLSQGNTDHLSGNIGSTPWQLESSENNL